MKKLGFKNPSFQKLANTLPYDYEMVEKICIIFRDLKIAENFLVYCYRKHVNPIEYYEINLKDAIKTIEPVAKLSGVSSEEMIAALIILVPNEGKA